LIDQGSRLADRPRVARPDELPFKVESLCEDGDEVQKGGESGGSV